MATSDELLDAIEKIAINYETSPSDDALPDAPNWHYSMLGLLQAIEYNLRILAYCLINGNRKRNHVRGANRPHFLTSDGIEIDKCQTTNPSPVQWPTTRPGDLRATPHVPPHKQEH